MACTVVLLSADCLNGCALLTHMYFVYDIPNSTTRIGINVTFDNTKSIQLFARPKKIPIACPMNGIPYIHSTCIRR